MDWPVLPGYELLQPLGGGPLTQVFRARAQATDELHALKLLRPELADDATAIKLIQREARAGLAVSHPQLVRLLAAHVLQPPHFLVFELLTGESLRDKLRRDYALDLRTALWVIRQTAEALAALHRAGFVHGDVKPDNIRWVDAGTAKLLDLGFAHRPGENVPLLGAGFILGTANYLAPELCGGELHDDTPADVFSLGVVLFELLTGTLPYPPGTQADTLAAHRTSTPTTLGTHPGRWPLPLVDLVGQMLARRPGQRPRASTVVQRLMSLEIGQLQQRRSA
jgi:serine/threonine protein kinase